ncbi:hypothetical protein ONE63_003405 [Megalurothrips usitatus]|uniref:Regulatory protein zeste n=1 Tax=Megalurothrips usitatus TaxID=439358 RepID=A0AAV7X772_9NEOP|nr:hypothetical protein ONE63_003405 [Megalurothrips usitatus]
MAPPPKKIKVGKDDDSRARMPNPTIDEKEEIIMHMERHQNYATGRLKCSDARRRMKEMHLKLAERVNAVKYQSDENGHSKKGGPDRTGEQRWKTWVSMRNWAKAYASANYKCKDTKSGGGARDDSICSTVGTVEKTPEYACEDTSVNRIMAIIGWHNALGIGIPDELDNDKTNEGNDENMNVSFGDVVSSTPGKSILRKQSSLGSTLGTSVLKEKNQSASASASTSDLALTATATAKTCAGHCCSALEKKVDSLLQSVEENKRMLSAIMEALGNRFINVESSPMMPNVAAAEEIVHIDELSGIDFNVDNFLVFSPDSGSC